MVAGIPLSFFTADIKAGKDLGNITEHATGMTRAQIVDAGGFWAYL